MSNFLYFQRPDLQQITWNMSGQDTASSVVSVGLEIISPIFHNFLSWGSGAAGTGSSRGRGDGGVDPSARNRTLTGPVDREDCGQRTFPAAGPSAGRLGAGTHLHYGGGHRPEAGRADPPGVGH